MILTVTPDPAVDKILMVERWTPGVPMWAKQARLSVGGKGLDASVALRHLGQPTVGLAFLAGETGGELAGLLEAYGIPLEAVWAGGVTRTATIINELAVHRHNHIFSGGLEIDPAQREAFLQSYRAKLVEAGWVIAGGVLPPSLPENFYAAIVEEALHADKPILIDCFRAFMLQALPSHPTVAKLNWREFESTFALQAVDLQDLKQKAAGVYHQHGLETLVVTCGPDGMLAFTRQGVFHAVPPRLEAVNAAGAGDAASAAIAWRRQAGDGWPETLRWAAAVSAAAVLTEGTGDCRMQDVQQILPQVQVRSI
jgi:1-phosphofructokinase family hexose kinase